ncbi:hypothetical protein D3C72_2386090 [compost metagenome]
MRQKRAGHGFPDDQTNHRMACQPSLGISPGRTGQGLVNTKGLFPTPVSLARHIDHRHDGSLLCFINVSRDRFTDYLG